MGLLNSATSVNRVVDAALHVTYARRVVYGSWVYVALNMTTTYYRAWEYSRVATKTYRYVGLTETAAKSVAEELTELFTRSTKVSEWNGTSGEFDVVPAGVVPMADVVCQHDEGDAWSVVVNVNEQDSRIDLAPDKSFGTLFATENSRSYDDGDDEE